MSSTSRKGTGRRLCAALGLLSAAVLSFSTVMAQAPAGYPMPGANGVPADAPAGGFPAGGFPGGPGGAPAGGFPAGGFPGGGAGGPPGPGAGGFPGPGGPGPGGPGGPGGPDADFLLNMIVPPLPPGSPKPPTDPKDLEGTWFSRTLPIEGYKTDMFGRKVPLNAQGQQTLDERLAADKAGSPLNNAVTSCRQPGQPTQLDLNFPFQIYQTKDEIDFIFEEFHGIWKIRMNQPHRTDGRREYMGDSIGWWDGNTLVVETKNFLKPLWLDNLRGTPASEDAVLTHRIRKIENNEALEIVTTIDDPKNYTRPWTIVRPYAWRPNKLIFEEYNCEQQIGAKGGVAKYGVSEGP